jgi:hypothetical protein
VRALLDEIAHYPASHPRAAALREQLKEEEGRFSRIELADAARESYVERQEPNAEGPKNGGQ